MCTHTHLFILYYTNIFNYICYYKLSIYLNFNLINTETFIIQYKNIICSWWKGQFHFHRLQFLQTHTLCKSAAFLLCFLDIKKWHFYTFIFNQTGYKNCHKSAWDRTATFQDCNCKICWLDPLLPQITNSYNCVRSDKQILDIYLYIISSYSNV